MVSQPEGTTQRLGFMAIIRPSSEEVHLSRNLCRLKQWLSNQIIVLYSVIFLVIHVISESILPFAGNPLEALQRPLGVLEPILKTGQASKAEPVSVSVKKASIRVKNTEKIAK